MKCLMVIAIVATIAAVDAASFSDEEKADIKQKIAQCKEQEKVSEEQLAKVKTGDFTDIGQEIKCFANCILEKSGVLKNGFIQEPIFLDQMGKIVGEEKVKQVLDMCRGEKGPNNCETAHKLLSCMKKNKMAIVE